MPDFSIRRSPSRDLTAAVERIAEIFNSAYTLLGGSRSPLEPSWREELDELLGGNREMFHRELAIMESSAERLNHYLTLASRVAEVRKYEKLLAEARERAGTTDAQ